jgi:hypothetical protein
VDALVFLDLHERFETGIDVIGQAQNAGSLVKVARGVAHLLAVGQQRIVILGAIECSQQRE